MLLLRVDCYKSWTIAFKNKYNLAARSLKKALALVKSAHIRRFGERLVCPLFQALFRNLGRLLFLSIVLQPIPKKGELSDPSNYQPVAITSLLSKIISIINHRLLRYLQEHQLISVRLYGFHQYQSAGYLSVYHIHRQAEGVERNASRQRLVWMQLKPPGLAQNISVPDNIWAGATIPIPSI